MTLRDQLLAWYDRAARDLPWRRRRDAYGIWVSEIMLQQTQVDTVRERYLRFLAEFPDLETLAAATEERVCEAWAGLGYYRRARNLHRAARLLARERGGAWPRTARELVAIPGIGRYTAGAVASMAFGEPVAAVDGNVVRVLSRLFAIEGRAGDSALERAVEARAAVLVAGERPGDVNQALMDLGATVCTPASPRCGGCPLRARCAARRTGEPARYPAPARPAKQRELAMALVLLRDAGGVYLRRRPLGGLWPGQWELPSATGPRARAALARELGIELGPVLARFEHVLTHRRVRVTMYAARSHPPATAGLVACADPLSAPLSALARKAVLAAPPEGSGGPPRRRARRRSSG